jgi:hypothetical protein
MTVAVPQIYAWVVHQVFAMHVQAISQKLSAQLANTVI